MYNKVEDEFTGWAKHMKLNSWQANAATISSQGFERTFAEWQKIEDEKKRPFNSIKLKWAQSKGPEWII